MTTEGTAIPAGGEAVPDPLANYHERRRHEVQIRQAMLDRALANAAEAEERKKEKRRPGHVKRGLAAIAAVQPAVTRGIAGAAAALPTVALASAPVPESQIMQAYRAWKRGVDWLNSAVADGLDNAIAERLADEHYEEEDRILAMPARDAQDVLVKLMIASLGGEVEPTGHIHGDSVFAEARAIIGWEA